jgi:hypothetical protein
VSRRRRGVVGFDLSLRAPAACFIPPGWALGDWACADFGYETFDPRHEVRDEEHAELRAAYRRIGAIVHWAADFVEMHQNRHACPVEVFVENYAFSKSSSSVTKLAELGGAMRFHFYVARRTVVRSVVASSARKLILGKLPRKDVKTVTQQALWDHGAPFADGDQADSFVVANAGLSELGLPFLSLA